MFITVCIKEDYLSYFDGIRMSDIAPSSFFFSWEDVCNYQIAFEFGLCA